MQYRRWLLACWPGWYWGRAPDASYTHGTPGGALLLCDDCTGHEARDTALHKGGTAYTLQHAYGAVQRQPAVWWHTLVVVHALLLPHLAITAGNVAQEDPAPSIQSLEQCTAAQPAHPVECHRIQIRHARTHTTDARQCCCTTMCCPTHMWIGSCRRACVVCAWKSPRLGVVIEQIACVVAWLASNTPQGYNHRQQYRTFDQDQHHATYTISQVNRGTAPREMDT